MSLVVEKIITQAIEDGQFEDLPGEGRPLPVEVNPNGDPAMATAHHLLRNHGFSLPWIEAGAQIEADRTHARGRLHRRRTWIVRQGTPLSGSIAWRETVGEFRATIAELNRRIDQFNLAVPLPRFQRPRIDPEAELAEPA